VAVVTGWRGERERSNGWRRRRMLTPGMFGATAYGSHTSLHQHYTYYVILDGRPIQSIEIWTRPSSPMKTLDWVMAVHQKGWTGLDYSRPSSPCGSPPRPVRNTAFTRLAGPLLPLLPFNQVFNAPRTNITERSSAGYLHRFHSVPHTVALFQTRYPLGPLHSAYCTLFPRR
jgi:hypothetical protein